MSIPKKLRQQVYDKYNGKCGYTGQPLDEKWQVDHVCPVSHWKWRQVQCKDNLNDINNLIPALRIINHYKRGSNLEQWRHFIMTLHKRLKKLPKKTRVQRTEERIKYLREVANHFDITEDKPFTGLFYFEKIINTL